MAAPKSVVKIKSNGIQYTSSVDRTEYTMMELSRAALRDVAKFVRARYKAEYYKHFGKRSGNGKFAISGKVFASKSTKYPRVEMGIKHSTKANPVRGWYSRFHETGTINEKARPVLKPIVADNIADIIKIESQYLSALEDEAKALSMIDSEDDYDILDGD